MFGPYREARVTIRIDDDHCAVRVEGRVVTVNASLRFAAVEVMDRRSGPNEGLPRTVTRRFDQIRAAGEGE